MSQINETNSLKPIWKLQQLNLVKSFRFCHFYWLSLSCFEFRLRKHKIALFGWHWQLTSAWRPSPAASSPSNFLNYIFKITFIITFIIILVLIKIIYKEILSMFFSGEYRHRSQVARLWHQTRRDLALIYSGSRYKNQKITRLSLQT